MSEQRRESAAPVEPYFDRTPQPFGDGPADPLVYDASPADAASAHRELRGEASCRHALCQPARPDHRRAAFSLASSRSPGRARVSGHARGDQGFESLPPAGPLPHH
jgi:hypothetical protein